MDNVLGFFGEFRFLSNFWPCEFRWEDITWSTSEHAYQAAKLKNKELMVKFSKLSTAKDAKIAGQLISCREDWDQVKYLIMYEIVSAKFNQNPELRRMLLDTGTAYLEETNTWNDTTWGVCRGVGKNWLGMILMQVRSELSRVEEKDILINQTLEF